MKFSVGDKVIDKSIIRARTSYVVYEVVAFLNGDLLTKFWGDGFGDEIQEDESRDEFDQPGQRSWREGIVRYQESEVFSPEEAVAELKRLEEEQSKLNEEFNAVRDLVRKNMEDAARLVKGATALVQPTGKDFYDLQRECMPLYEALVAGGWSHSSMKC